VGGDSVNRTMATQERRSLPLYSQIKAIIQAQIDDEDLKPGDRAPSERDLATRYGVSRMTARQALQALEQEGLIQRVQGVGSFVARSKITESLPQLVGFSEDMRRRGLTPSTVVISIREELPTRAIAKELQLSLGQTVTHIHRLRSASGERMALETASIPSHRCPGIADEDLTGSLYDLLERRYGIVLAHASQVIEGVHAGPAEAALLAIPVGSVLLRLRRNSRDAAGTPVEHVVALYRADRWMFQVDLQRGAGHEAVANPGS
jgi:GntR family transcriptional regulator